ncbi:hypothetical protein BDN72DRAFT_876277 [Pluteus cervinus]|uniref:Uncharacterized protein n=1 Tax=Pluteus cervinus TaxID=181527 RepID=A0ACD3B4Z0_9AGAR|nr:hypothetical protein BDN72DRAFT_876277 [Pluteus cervinus]
MPTSYNNLDDLIAIRDAQLNVSALCRQAKGVGGDPLASPSSNTGKRKRAETASINFQSAFALGKKPRECVPTKLEEYTVEYDKDLRDAHLLLENILGCQQTVGWITAKLVAGSCATFVPASTRARPVGHRNGVAYLRSVSPLYAAATPYKMCHAICWVFRHGVAWQWHPPYRACKNDPHNIAAFAAQRPATKGKFSSAVRSIFGGATNILIARTQIYEYGIVP